MKRSEESLVAKANCFRAAMMLAALIAALVTMLGVLKPAVAFETNDGATLPPNFGACLFNPSICTPPPPSPSDTTAPTVDQVFPAKTATDVALNTPVRATFSEAMLESSIGAGTFTLTKQGSSTPVAATVSRQLIAAVCDFSSCSWTTTATLDPSSNLTPNTTYTATIKGGSSGVKDAAGNALAQDYTWTFTTTTSQKLLDANTLGLGESVNAYTCFPCSGQKQVQTFTAEHDGQLTSAAVKIHVDSAGAPIESLKMDITTVDAATGLPKFELASTTIPSSDIPLLPVNTNPRLIPLTTLTFGNPATVKAGERYAIVIDTIASNTTSPHYLRWTTTLQSYNGGQGMWIRDDGSLAGFLPERGNVFDQVFATYVTPADTVATDTVAPSTIPALSPEPNAAGWNKEDTTLTLSATDNASGVKEITYVATGAQPITEQTVQGSSVTLPAITTEGETTVTYSATDNAGNAETEKTFKVKLDKSVPTVGTTTPTTKTGVSRTDPNITATFSEKVDKNTVEEIDPTTLKTANVKLTNTATGKQVGTTVSCDADPCNKVTITPKRALAANTKYKATVTSGTKDLAGHSLDQNSTTTGNQAKNWTFTTGKG